MKQLLALAIATGLTACTTTANDAAFCRPFFGDKVADLRGALSKHPETPEAVGQAATDVVIGYEAGCAE